MHAFGTCLDRTCLHRNIGCDTLSGLTPGLFRLNASVTSSREEWDRILLSLDVGYAVAPAPLPALSTAEFEFALSEAELVSAVFDRSNVLLTSASSRCPFRDAEDSAAARTDRHKFVLQKNLSEQITMAA